MFSREPDRPEESPRGIPPWELQEPRRDAPGAAENWELPRADPPGRRAMAAVLVISLVLAVAAPALILVGQKFGAAGLLGFLAASALVAVALRDVSRRRARSGPGE